jgi:hypothetical protein
MVQRNYMQIKKDIEDLINQEIGTMMSNAELARLIIKK